MTGGGGGDVVVVVGLGKAKVIGAKAASVPAIVLIRISQFVRSLADVPHVPAPIVPVATVTAVDTIPVALDVATATVLVSQFATPAAPTVHSRA